MQTKSSSVIVGSRQWCDEWADFYMKQAIKFSRLKYDGDELQMFYALFMHEFWRTETPWIN